MSCKENDNIILDQEHDNEETITLKEFIEAKDALEKEARAAYPGKFDCCTYGLGYIRQSLYACRSCLEGFEGGENKEAVICYACSVACHPSCDLIELGVRRHLRCDCECCSLQKCKDPINEENIYTSLHNFKGRFCRCDCSFSVDEEAPSEVMMMQCQLCEDWFHTTCMGLDDEATSALSAHLDSIICFDCCNQTKAIREMLSSSCKNQMSIEITLRGDALLPANWRNHVMSCTLCQELIADSNLTWLIQEELTYEPELDTDTNIDYSRLLDTLVDRQTVWTGIMAIKNLKGRLLQYLETIARENRPVTKTVQPYYF